MKSSRDDTEVNERRLDCWVQRADFSSREYKKLALSEAISRFHAIDWEAERALEREVSESCPPGFGVNPDIECFLHLCPRDAGIMDCNVSYVGQSVRHDVSSGVTYRSFMEVPFESAGQLIELFWGRDVGAVLALLSSRGREAAPKNEKAYVTPPPLSDNLDPAVIIRFIGLLVVANPLLVLASYGLGGWKAVVLALPVLLLFEVRFCLPSIVGRWPKKRTAADKAVRWAWLLTLVAIPLSAVLHDSLDVMRLWAPSVAIVLAAVMPEGGGARRQMDTGALIRGGRVGWLEFAASVAVFTGLSELLWHFMPLWLWLAYHASFMLVFAGIASSVRHLTVGFADSRRHRG